VVKLGRRVQGTAPTSNGFGQYLLLKNTGPLSPTYDSDKGEVYDANTGESMVIGGGS
jgi:hypothetical protein